MKNGSGVAKCPTFPEIANFCKFSFPASLLFALLRSFCVRSCKSDRSDTSRPRIGGKTDTSTTTHNTLLVYLQCISGGPFPSAQDCPQRVSSASRCWDKAGEPVQAQARGVGWVTRPPAHRSEGVRPENTCAIIPSGAVWCGAAFVARHTPLVTLSIGLTGRDLRGRVEWHIITETGGGTYRHPIWYVQVAIPAIRNTPYAAPSAADCYLRPVVTKP